MMIVKDSFVRINKWALFSAIFLYLIGVFTPLKYLQPGLLFAFFAGFFCLFHKDYFAPKPRLAGHLWMLPLGVTILTMNSPLTKGDGNPLLFHTVLADKLYSLFAVHSRHFRGKACKETTAQGSDHPHRGSMLHIYALGIGYLVLLH